MSGPPSARGFVSKIILNAIRALPEGRGPGILARIPSSTPPLIDSTPRLGWVSLEATLQPLDVLRKDVGAAAFRQFSCALTEQIMAYPLLSTFIDSTVRLFGPTPQTMLKWSTHAWDQSVRDSGRLTYHEPPTPGPGPRRAWMQVEDAPALVLREESSFSESLAGTFEALLRRASIRSRVEVRAPAPRATCLIHDISWG